MSSKTVSSNEMMDIVWDVLVELQDENADIYTRWAAAQELRRMFGLPLDHHPECAVHRDRNAKCNCGYWGSAEHGKVHILLN